MVFPTSGHTLGTSPWAKPRPKAPITPPLKVAVNCIFTCSGWLRHGAGRRFRSCGAARRTAGGVPQGRPSLLPNLKPCFPPLTCGSDRGSWSAWDGFCARGASSRYITGSELRPVQCLHTAASRACLRVGRPARLDLLVAAGRNQAPARPVREWSMQAMIGRSCATQPPDWTQWLVRTAGGSPKILGEGSGLGAPAPLAAQAAARGAQRHLHRPDDGEDRCSRCRRSRRSDRAS